jgi:predicted PurR-regulated permease PerM
MSQTNRPILISITPGTVIRIIAIFILAYFLFVLRDLVLVLITSVVIASAVEPFAGWLISKKIPRVVSVIIVYLGTLIFFGTIFYFFVPSLIADIRLLLNNIPDYVNTLSDKAVLINNIPEVNNFLNSISSSIENNELIDQFGGAIYGATYSFLNIITSFFGGFLSFILIIVLSFYLSVQDDGVANFIKIIVPAQHENYVLDLWKRTRRKIGLWMQGQLLLGVLVGVLTYLGLILIGVENALLLAIIAALFELIPVFGPILAAVPAVAFGLSQGGLTLALIVTGLYVVIQQFESQLIHPLVVKKIVGIPALIAILALIAGAQLAGFLGIILSVPIAAAIMEYVSDLEKKKIREMKELRESNQQQ